MTIEMLTRDIFMRITSPDGKARVQSFRVWDADRFVAARAVEALKANEKEDDPKNRKAKAEQITEATYLKEKSK